MPGGLSKAYPNCTNRGYKANCRPTDANVRYLTGISSNSLSPMVTLQVATNGFFTALKWSAGKPTVAKTRLVSPEASHVSAKLTVKTERQVQGKL